MTCAFAIAELSHARRKKVGAILVSSGGGIIAEGVNGMPAGFDNCCEVPADHDFDFHVPGLYHYCKACAFSIKEKDAEWPDCTALVTKPEVLHAELNAIAKVADSTNRSGGSTLYVTMCPCSHCVNLIIPAKIVRVVYAEEYRATNGIEPMRRAGIIVEQYND